MSSLPACGLNETSKETIDFCGVLELLQEQGSPLVHIYIFIDYHEWFPGVYGHGTILALDYRSCVLIASTVFMHVLIVDAWEIA
jgi:hypothetical protein